jgi:hypothetical protein
MQFFAPIHSEPPCAQLPGQRNKIRNFLLSCLNDRAQITCCQALFSFFSNFFTFFLEHIENSFGISLFISTVLVGFRSKSCKLTKYLIVFVKFRPKFVFDFKKLDQKMHSNYVLLGEQNGIFGSFAVESRYFR